MSTAADTLTKEELTLIGSFLSVPVEQLNAIETSILSNLKTKVEQFTELQSQSLKNEVSLEELQKTSQGRINDLRTQLEDLIEQNASASEEKKKIEKELSDEKKESFQLSSTRDNLRAELKEIQEKFDNLQKQNQDTIKLLDRKISQNEVEKELTLKLTNQYRESTAKCHDLEDEIQSLKYNDSLTETTMNKLSQDLKSISEIKERLETELENKDKKMSEYYSNCQAEIQTLRKKISTLENNCSIIKSENDALKKENRIVSSNLHEKSSKVQELTNLYNTEKEESQKELSLKQEMIDVLQTQVQKLQDDYTRILNTKQPIVQNDEERNLEVEELKQKLIETETQLNKELEERRNITMQTESSTLSNQQQEDLDTIKKELIQERYQKEKLQNQVEIFIVELEKKVPTINSFKQRTDMLEKELTDATLLLENLRREKNQVTNELDALRQNFKSVKWETKSLTKQRNDLAHQLQYILIHTSVQNDSNGPLSAEEVRFIQDILDNESNEESSDSQQVISERLVTFQNIVELQQKNIDLLKSVRELARKLELQEEHQQSTSQVVEQQAIDEAKEAIISLQSYNTKLEDKIKTLNDELDCYKSLPKPDTKVETEHLRLNEENTDLIKELETRLATSREESNKTFASLNNEIDDIRRNHSQTVKECQNERASRELAEQRLKLIQNSLSLSKVENEQLQKRLEILQDITLKQDQRTQETLKEYVSCKVALSNSQNELNYIQSQLNISKTNEKSLKDDITIVSKERNELKELVSQLQSLQTEREQIFNSTKLDSQTRLDTVERELYDISEKLA